MFKRILDKIEILILDRILYPIASFLFSIYEFTSFIWDLIKDFWNRHPESIIYIWLFILAFIGLSYTEIRVNELEKKLNQTIKKVEILEVRIQK